MFKEIFSRSSKSSLNGGEVKSFTPQLAAFLEQLPTAVLVLKSSGKIEFANEAAGVLLQETGKKLKGVHVGKLGITEAFLQELVVDSPAKRVLTIADMQANSFKVHVGAKLLGESPFILLTLEEIPLLSRLEKEKTFLVTVLENHPLPVTVQDREGNCIVASAQARKLFGFTEQEAKQKSMYELLPKEITVSLQRLDEEAWVSATRLDPVRLAYKSDEGHERMLSVSKAVLPGADGKPYFIVNVYEEITKHYEWEQDLQHSQKLLQAILDNIPLGVYTRDCDTKVTFINRQGLQILGEQPATLEKKHDQQTQEESDSYIQREQSILKDGKTYECPAEEYVDSSGKKRAVHVIKVPLTDAGPKPLVLTIVDDITKRQQQEREIKRVNSMLSAIVQNAPIALYARAENGRMLLRNKQCNALFGDAKEEDFDERSRLPHETDEQVTQYLNREQEILRKGETLDIPEEEYTTSHGETKLLHMVKAPVPGDTPESRCVITLVEDITIKKEQERALVESKNFLQTVINQLPVSLSVKDYNGKYILWNKKSEELFGVQARDVIGKDNYRTDLNKDQAEFVRETDLRVFESHREQNIPQELISSAQDGIKIMHTVKTPVYNPDGTPNCLLVVSEDITAKTKMEKQIMEASDKNTLLVENAREGVVILEDGKIIYANRAFCTLLGFDTLEDIKGKKLLDFSTENHLVFLKEKYEAVLAGTDTKAEPIEAHFVRKNGSTVEAKFACVLSKYLGRRIMLGFASDVTASNRVLRELKKERDNFRQSFENSSVPSFILSAKGYVSVMNE
ncbi:MAG: PAS domain S-box protein, partial [Elusimicrobiaceae bacterium]|nr:PAS domain S-box protein [Elusimicrobiaceae bacterium]